MLHPVFLFVLTGKFVFFNISLHIILHTRAHNQSVLGATIHGLGIHIILLPAILNQPSILFESSIVFQCFPIHLLVMLIEARFKIDFGFDDVIQGFWISFGLGTSFF